MIESPQGLVGIEVKAAALRGPRVSRSSRSFIAAYHPHRFVVVNTALTAQDAVDGTRVHWVGPEALEAPASLLS